MPHNAAFHQGLLFLLRQKSIFRERKTIFLGEIITGDPSIYIMDHSDFTVSNFMEDSICLKRVEDVHFIPLFR